MLQVGSLSSLELGSEDIDTDKFVDGRQDEDSTFLMVSSRFFCEVGVGNEMRGWGLEEGEERLKY